MPLVSTLRRCLVIPRTLGGSEAPPTHTKNFPVDSDVARRCWPPATRNYAHGPHRDKTMIECSGQPRPTTASLERHVPRPGARPRRRVVRTLVCLMSHRAAWMLLPAWQSPSPPHPRLPAVAPDARRLARVLVRARDMLERVSARCLAPTSSGVAVCGRAAGERERVRTVFFKTWE